MNALKKTLAVAMLVGGLGFLATFGALGISSPGMASAQVQYGGTCPQYWTLAPAAVEPEADRNGNGFVCTKTAGNGNVLVKDDHVPQGRVAACPAGYEPTVASGDYAGADSNADGQVCTRQTGTGEYVVRDNRDD